MLSKRKEKNAAISKSILVWADGRQDELKRPQAWILPMYTSIHELQCLQENSLIIDADAKSHDGGLQQDRRCLLPHK